MTTGVIINSSLSILNNEVTYSEQEFYYTLMTPRKPLKIVVMTLESNCYATCSSSSFPSKSNVIRSKN